MNFLFLTHLAHSNWHIPQNKIDTKPNLIYAFFTTQFNFVDAKNTSFKRFDLSLDPLKDYRSDFWIEIHDKQPKYDKIFILSDHWNVALMIKCPLFGLLFLWQT